MKKILIIILGLFFYIQSNACTTFFFTDEEGNMRFGRNFDFPVGMGHMIINQRNLQKTAFIRPPEKPLQWISKYGSISFNQAGREFPYGGMNEAGLVIEQMWLQETRYPEMDDRYGLSELQWIQYQLDMSASVEDVIKSDSFLRISPSSVATLHFLVADKSGAVATIEYIDGKMVVHKQEQLPYPVLANCPYDRSLDYVENLNKGSKKSFSGWTENSSGRFAEAAKLLQAYDGKQSMTSYAFMVLDKVAQENSTQWSIVYNLNEQKISYKTRSNKNIKSISFDEVDFSCGEDRLYADMNTNSFSAGDLQPYSYEENLKLIEDMVSGVDFLRNSLPREVVVASAQYPAGVKCIEEEAAVYDEEVYVQIPGSRLYLRMRGNPENPILLNLHGGPGGYSGIDIKLMGPGLEDHYLVAYLDQRGCGKSDACTDKSMLTVEQYVQDLDIVIDTLLKKYNKKQINLMGTSWGGMYGFLYLLENQDKVAAYACIDGKVNSHYQNHSLIDYELELIEEQLAANPEKEKEKELKQMRKELRRIKKSDFAEFHTDVNRIKHEFPPKLGFNAYFVDTSKIITTHDVLNDTELLALMKYTPAEYMKVGEKAEVVNKAFRDTPSYNNMNIEKKLRSITIPVAVIQGEQDHVVGKDHAHIIYQALRSVPGYMKEIHIIEGVAHVPAIESPEKLKEILLAFFDKYGSD